MNLIRGKIDLKVLVTGGTGFIGSHLVESSSSKEESKSDVSSGRRAI